MAGVFRESHIIVEGHVHAFAALVLAGPHIPTILGDLAGHRAVEVGHGRGSVRIRRVLRTQIHAGHIAAAVALTHLRVLRERLPRAAQRKLGIVVICCGNGQVAAVKHQAHAGLLGVGGGEVAVVLAGERGHVQLGAGEVGVGVAEHEINRAFDVAAVHVHAVAGALHVQSVLTADDAAVLQVHLVCLGVQRHGRRLLARRRVIHHVVIVLEGDAVGGETCGTRANGHGGALVGAKVEFILRHKLAVGIECVGRIVAGANRHRALGGHVGVGEGDARLGHGDLLAIVARSDLQH